MINCYKAALILSVAIVMPIIIIGCNKARTASAGGAVAPVEVSPSPPQGVWDGTVDTSWYRSWHKESVIATAAQLAGLARVVNGGDDFTGKTVKLGANIMLNDTADWRSWAGNPPFNGHWEPIGSTGNQFCGTFDGNGFTVSGAYIDDTGKDVRGLFGAVGVNGMVKGLGVTASYIKGGNCIGVLVGGNTGRIIGCYSVGETVGGSAVGGLVGVSDDGAISGSYSAGIVTGKVYVGGLIGVKRVGAVSACYSICAVSGDSAVGGFVGAGMDWGAMMGGNFSAGAVAGRADVGGFVGRNVYGVTKGNYYDKEASGQSVGVGSGIGKAGGKTTAQMQSKEFADSLNTTAKILSTRSVWVHSAGKYPALKEQKAVGIGDGGIGCYFAGGIGTPDNPYIINNKEQLVFFSHLVNFGARLFNRHFKLGTDIALNDTANWRSWADNPPANVWMPIGAHHQPFLGTFDGGGHTVSGVYACDSVSSLQGLFGVMGVGGAIKNLGVTASYIKGRAGVGGLLGQNGGRVSNSYSTALVEAEHNVGGLVGVITSGGKVSGCYAAGNVSGNKSVGGLVGGNNGMVSNSYSTGSVSAKEKSVGGLVGYNSWDGAVSNSYAAGAVISGGLPAGGILGQPNKGCTPHDSYYDSQTSGQSARQNDNAGKNTAQMRYKGTFRGWDFDTIWGINSEINNGYPHLLKRLEKPGDDGGKLKAVQVNTVWYNESASEFTINTAEELAGFSMLVNGWDDFKGKTVKLGRDIMLNDTTRWRSWLNKAPKSSWTPIGKDSNNVFRGTFDGGGRVVSGIYINDDSNAGLGLFGRLGVGGTVKKLGLVNSFIKGKYYLGGLVGENSGSVNNCYSTAWVMGNAGVGGLVGVNADSGTVSGSYAAGEVMGVDNVGGFVGINDGSVINSYSTAWVSSTYSYHHRFVGDGKGKVSGSYYRFLRQGDEKNSGGNTDGIGKTTAELKQKATFTEWDFSESWGINGTVNNGYPHLLGFVYKGEPAKSAGVGAKLIKKIWDGSVDMKWYTDNANKSEYIIATAQELAGFALLMSYKADLFDGKTVKLGANIMLNDTANWRDWATDPPANKWIPIGGGHEFNGTFDGGGFVISGIYIRSTERGQGLFGRIGKGIVKNLGASASYIKGKDKVGGLAGEIFGHYGSDYSMISNSHYVGMVIGDDTVGGLVGSIFGDSKISNNYSAGTVTGNRAVGGFAGQSRYSRISNNYSTAAVTGVSVVGGFVGKSVSGEVCNNYSTGAVEGKEQTGGFMGVDDGTQLLTGCYYDGKTSGQSDSGKGVPRATAKMQSAEFADSLNVVAGILSMNAWVYGSGKYPKLSNRVSKAVKIGALFASGTGTSAAPYMITTPNQLKNVALLVNMGVSFLGEHLKLGANIMLNDTANWKGWGSNPPAYEWTSIGTDKNRFCGTFDGGGFAVSGVYTGFSKYGRGLFGVVDGGTVKNLGVSASHIKGEGGLVGRVYGGGSGYSRTGGYSRIDNCYYMGMVESAEDNVHIGGLVGEMDGGDGSTINNSYSICIVMGAECGTVGGLVGVIGRGTIKNSYSAGAVTGKEDVGGLVGYSYGGSISGSYSTSAVNGKRNIGGLVGRNGQYNSSDSGYGGTVTNCYSTGFVTGSKGVGGLIGNNDNGGDVRNSYSVGAVRGKRKSAGGLIGSSRGGSYRRISGCYHDKEASWWKNRGIGVARSKGKAYGKTTEQMREGATFTGWDFDTVWGIAGDVNGGYPYLRENRKNLLLDYYWQKDILDGR
jgi:hypothetical protein